MTLDVGPEPVEQEMDFHRVTLSVPISIDRQVRRIQGEIIVQEGRQCSYTEVILSLVTKGLSSVNLAS